MYQTRLLFTIGDDRIQFIPSLNITCFRKGMAIDADGYPAAYHPDNTGLDDLVHAGYPGNWWGIATHDASSGGDPVIQTKDDPAPGYYVTTTSLVNNQFGYHDPRRYVDASSIPYFVLPDHFKESISLGDIAWVFNPENRRHCFAIFADVGPAIGEGSMYLAAQLGIDNDPRSGGVDQGILFFIFDGSGQGNGIHLSAEQIQEAGAACMAAIDKHGLVDIFS